MRAVVQRVSQACVRVDGEEIAGIGKGLVALVGVEGEDERRDAEYMAGKIAGLRVFEDAGGKMNLSVGEVEGAVLLVSQFTLYGDCRRGRRPSFTRAAEPARAEQLYAALADELRATGLSVPTGRFRAMMQLSLVNEGPVTILLDSRKEF